jgi:hypothetical protein
VSKNNQHDGNHGRRNDDPLERLPEPVAEALERAVASVPDKAMPAWMYGDPPPASARRSTRRRPFRIAVAAAAVAAVVVAVFVIGDLNEIPSVKTDALERAAAPTSSVVPPSPTAGTTDDAPDPVEAQLAADAIVAARFGLTLGRQVIGDDGAIVIEDQPDLVPVIGDDVVEGYALRGDVYGDEDLENLVVYGPDGQTIRGVLENEAGFIPLEDEPG